jgi:hypothetical protein
MRAGRRLTFSEDFDGAELDTDVWSPYYLPAWSSRTQTSATYTVSDSCLHLSIPADQGMWLAGEHSPMRVSGIQSGNGSGPVGSTLGQQPPFDDAMVREYQPAFRGWTPSGGHLEIRMRAEVSPRSMFAWWMVGLEDVPECSAEICVAEIFGDTINSEPSAAVGTGLHPFRDPRSSKTFAPRPSRSTSVNSTTTRWTGPTMPSSSLSMARLSGDVRIPRPTRCR